MIIANNMNSKYIAGVNKIRKIKSLTINIYTEESQLLIPIHIK